MAKRGLTDAGIQRLSKPKKESQKDHYDRLTPGLALRVSPRDT